MTIELEQQKERILELFDIIHNNTWRINDPDPDNRNFINDQMRKLSSNIKSLFDEAGKDDFKNFLLSPLDKDYGRVSQQTDTVAHAAFQSLSHNPEIFRNFLHYLYNSLGSNDLIDIALADSRHSQSHHIRTPYEMIGDNNMILFLPALLECADDREDVIRKIACISPNHYSNLLGSLLDSDLLYISETDQDIFVKIVTSFLNGHENDLIKALNVGGHYYPDYKHNPNLPLLLIDKFASDESTLKKLLPIFCGYDNSPRAQDKPIPLADLLIYTMGEAKTKGMSRGGHIEKDNDSHGRLVIKSNALQDSIKDLNQLSYNIPPKNYKEELAFLEVMTKLNTLALRLDPDHLKIDISTGNVYVSPIINSVLKSSGKSWQDMKEQLTLKDDHISKPYTLNQITNICDTVDAFTRMVVLPVALRVIEKNGYAVPINHTKILEGLRTTVFSALFGAQKINNDSVVARELRTILALSERWHDRGIYRHIREKTISEIAAKWHPIIEPQELTISGGKFNGWTIKNLTSSDEIHREHERQNMGTCIHTFEDEFLSGKQHVILFVDDKGQSRAYARVSFDQDQLKMGYGIGRKGLKLEALRGRQIHGQTLDSESTEFYNLFTQLLDRNTFSVQTNKHGDVRAQYQRNLSMQESLITSVGYDYYDRTRHQEVFDIFCCTKDNQFGDALRVGKDNTFVRLPKTMSKKSISVETYLAQTGIIDAIHKVLEHEGYPVQNRYEVVTEKDGRNR